VKITGILLFAVGVILGIIFLALPIALIASKLPQTGLSGANWNAINWPLAITAGVLMLIGEEMIRRRKNKTTRLESNNLKK